MAKLLELQERLLETGAALAQVEKAIAQAPASTALRWTAQSLRKRQEILEAEFLTEADETGVEVCSYRLFAQAGMPAAAAAGQALVDWQALVAVTYDAERHGPKHSAKVGARSVAESEFRFAYSFPGSVGFVLTIPNERLLVGETFLEQSITDVFALVRCDRPEAVREFVGRLGPAVVRAAYRWAANHTAYGLGADIQWRRGQGVRAQLLVEPPQLTQLQEVIGRTSDEKVEEQVVIATLVGADLPRHSFHLSLDVGGEIRGTFNDAISDAQKAELPRKYRATLRKTTTVRYSTEQETVAYFLTKLEPPI